MVERSLNRARACLLAKQDPAGYWCGELQGDSILESEYLLLKWILGQESDPDLPLIANYLRRLQQPALFDSLGRRPQQRWRLSRVRN